VSDKQIPPEDLAYARRLVARYLLAITGLSVAQAEALTFQFEVQSRFMKVTNAEVVRNDG